MKCKITKSPSTCSTKQETSDSFYRIYLYSISFMVILLLAGVLDYKSYLLLRCISKIQKGFRSLGKINFCNPMHGDPVHLCRGALIYKVTVEEIDMGLIDQECCLISQFTDLSGFYFITDGKVHVKIADQAGYTVNMEENKIKQLKRYFFDCTMNNDMCATNHEENHYLRTEDVINMLAMGMSLVKKEKLCNGYILSIDPLLIESLVTIFQLKRSFASLLIKHNEMFFKGYNVKALELCLSNKMQHYKRPDGVNNSQWKWYTSDFCRLAGENGFNYRSQVVWYPSKAMNDVKFLSPSEFEVEEKLISIKPKLSISSKILRSMKESVAENTGIMFDRLNLSNPCPKKIPDDEEEWEAFEKCKKLVDNYTIEAKSMVTGCVIESNKVSISESAMIWAKKSQEIIKKANEKFHEVSKYEDKVKNPKKLILPVKYSRADVKRRDFLLSTGKEYVHRTEEVSRPTTSGFVAVFRNFQRVQEVVNRFVLATNNSYSILESLNEEAEKELGEISDKLEIKVSTRLLAKELVSLSTKKFKDCDRKVKQKKKKKSKKKTVQKSSGVIGLSKYLSKDFNQCCDMAKKMMENEEFKSDLRCKAIIELYRYLRKKYVDEITKDWVLRKDLPKKIYREYRGTPEDHKQGEEAVRNICFI